MFLRIISLASPLGLPLIFLSGLVSFLGKTPAENKKVFYPSRKSEEKADYRKPWVSPAAKKAGIQIIPAYDSGKHGKDYRKCNCGGGTETAKMKRKLFFYTAHLSPLYFCLSETCA